MRKGKGWSLLELLTVIAIIAILVAILFPVFSRAKDAAKKATCLADISQLAKAMRLYSLDYNDYICFVRGRAGNDPLYAGQYGTGYYLHKAMKAYVPAWEVWFCPSDSWAKRDFTCNANDFGTYNYTASGLGYKAVSLDADTDLGILKMYSDLVKMYGRADMVNNHNESSYRLYGHQSSGEEVPAYIDGVYRLYRNGWGAYGYWDVNPSSCELFQEDFPMHSTGVGGANGKVYGKSNGFRDGHATFTTFETHGMNNYGENPNDAM
jgi:prepilin-type N-terminal cleavage/methylation domain-containing protein